MSLKYWIYPVLHFKRPRRPFLPTHHLSYVMSEFRSAVLAFLFNCVLQSLFDFNHYNQITWIFYLAGRDFFKSWSPYNALISQSSLRLTYVIITFGLSITHFYDYSPNLQTNFVPFSFFCLYIHLLSLQTITISFRIPITLTQLTIS